MVTSGRPFHGSTCHSAPAERWLRTAPGPPASVAAIERPARVTASYPTAYTPR